MTGAVASDGLGAAMSAGRDEVVVGLMRTAGLDLALPLAALREVVPCPDELGEVPAAAVGLLGVMTLRSTIVPVVDVAHLLGRVHDREVGQVVVVVAHEGRVLGLLVDAIRGMAAIGAHDLVGVAAQGGGLLFSNAFHDPTHGHVVSMIDPEAVLSLPGVPVVVESAATSVVAATSTAGRRATRSLTLVRCGTFSLAIDVAYVHSTIPTPHLQPSPADGPTCLGVTPVAGFDVAVADVLTLLQLGELRGSALECGLVLDLPAGQVVLGVSSMIGLQDVSDENVVPLPAMASPCPELLTHVADVPGVGPCLLIDGERLLAESTIVSLSRIATETGTISEDGGAAGTQVSAVTAGPLHLSYTAGVPLASELSQVVEVLAYPDDFVRSTGAPGVLGFVVHRGVAVPVLCLAEVIGREPPEYGAASRLLLLDVDGDSLAFAVTGLHAILPLSWVDASPSRAASSSSILRSCQLVQLATMSGLLPVLDLHALARSVRGAGVQIPGQRAPQEQDAAQRAG